MINFFRQIIKPKYESLNKIEIIKANILANFNYLQSQQPEAEIFPVLKSNGYGHGLKEMCRILNEAPAKMVVVDSFPEAQIVYHNFKRRVLILSELPLAAYEYCKFKRTEFCVYNLKTFLYLAKHHPRAQIHLFINTGMNREGITDLEEFLKGAGKYLERVEIVGLLSHLASADQTSDLNKAQENKFMQALDILHAHKIFPKWVHLGNSAGIFTLNNKRLTAYRAGISLYGYNVFSPLSVNYEKAKKLKPALQLFSTIIGQQDLRAGDKVSYNETYIAVNDTKIALVPFGYYEGLDRRLTSQAKFLVQSAPDFWAQIAGRVCMNLICLDCGQNNFQIGNRVEIISAQLESPNSIDNLANISQTISYEILVKLQTNIHREII